VDLGADARIYNEGGPRDPSKVATGLIQKRQHDAREIVTSPRSAPALLRAADSAAQGGYAEGRTSVHRDQVDASCRTRRTCQQAPIGNRAIHGFGGMAHGTLRAYQDSHGHTGTGTGWE
jgi:hypothetical protein